MSRKTRIEQILDQQCQPDHLEVIDESAMHNVPKGAESHFKVLIVSEGFVDESRLQRHRRINALLGAEFGQGLHALSIHAWSPEEWREQGGVAPNSPRCRGGSKARVVSTATTPISA
jgi:BolA protein